MLTHRRKGKSIWDPAIVRRAAIDAVVKLHPRTMAKNPVMFVVEVGSVLTTLAFGGNGHLEQSNCCEKVHGP